VNDRAAKLTETWGSTSPEPGECNTVLGLVLQSNGMLNNLRLPTLAGLSMGYARRLEIYPVSHWEIVIIGFRSS